MAVRLQVTLTGLRVRFSGADLVAAGSRGIFLPYTRILGARVMARADAVASSPRLPCPGLWWPRRYRAGCWGVGERRQLWSARHGTHVVVIYLSGRPFHRVVVDVDQPDRVHRRIDAALLHSKKTSPRRSIRRHRRSAADHPEADPPRTDERSRRHPAPNGAPVPAHASAECRTATGEQPCAAALEAAPALPPEPAPPGSIDPDVAARLRLYEYRDGERARRASRGPEPASTRRR
ncbi:hypothetical protein C8D89_10195 [Actinomycetospora cinnamomea]|uniref:Uncharacterized protein n=1 Tax=Actinomycetospora cinnamomea TaxID=663609 RepID=A0A2U1FPX0_9PSEU|nr:hypothetical protein C8D89_10195 [Actinomycetospora cinnamomea]